MKKTICKKWLKPLFFVILVSLFSLASCGDNEKDEPQITDENPIVGIWLDDNDTWAFKLNADGTGTEYLKEMQYFDKTDITWKYDSSTKHLIIYDGEGEWRWNFEVLELTNNKLRAIESGGSYYTLQKQSNLSFLDNWDI